MSLDLINCEFASVRSFVHNFDLKLRIFWWTLHVSVIITQTNIWIELSFESKMMMNLKYEKFFLWNNVKTLSATSDSFLIKWETLLNFLFLSLSGNEVGLWVWCEKRVRKLLLPFPLFWARPKLKSQHETTKDSSLGKKGKQEKKETSK